MFDTLARNDLNAWIPKHPALTPLAWEDDRTDVHAAGTITHGWNGEEPYVTYECACGFKTDECANDFDATCALFSHALHDDLPAEPVFAVIASRTDSQYRAVAGENLTADQAAALIAANREICEPKHLRDANGDLVPYLSVARWTAVPLTEPTGVGVNPHDVALDEFLRAAV